MKTDDFIKQLNNYIKAVFAHEKKFIEDLLPFFKNYEIDYFYMASERCKVGIINARSGQVFTSTVKTQDFLNWYEQNKET